MKEGDKVLVITPELSVARGVVEVSQVRQFKVRVTGRDDLLVFTRSTQPSRASWPNYSSRWVKGVFCAPLEFENSVLEYVERRREAAKEEQQRVEERRAEVERQQQERLRAAKDHVGECGGLSEIALKVYREYDITITVLWLPMPAEYVKRTGTHRLVTVRTWREGDVLLSDYSWVSTLRGCGACNGSYFDPSSEEDAVWYAITSAMVSR